MIVGRRGIVFNILRAFAAIGIAGALVMPAVAASSRHGRGVTRHGHSVSGPRVRAYAIGDSVMLDAAPGLEQSGFIVDAAVSRQFVTGIDILRWRRAAGGLPRLVVVDLGTNGPISSALFDEMMGVLHGVPRVIFVTVKEPRWWEGEVNDVLRAGVARWQNARLVDWYAYSLGHPDWFWGDGIHLTPAGAAAYAQLVVAAAA